MQHQAVLEPSPRVPLPPGCWLCVPKTVPGWRVSRCFPRRSSSFSLSLNVLPPRRAPPEPWPCLPSVGIRCSCPALWERAASPQCPPQPLASVCPETDDPSVPINLHIALCEDRSEASCSQGFAGGHRFDQPSPQRSWWGWAGQGAQCHLCALSRAQRLGNMRGNGSQEGAP